MNKEINNTRGISIDKVRVARREDGSVSYQKRIPCLNAEYCRESHISQSPSGRVVIHRPSAQHSLATLLLSMRRHRRCLLYLSIHRNQFATKVIALVGPRLLRQMKILYTYNIDRSAPELSAKIRLKCWQLTEKSLANLRIHVKRRVNDFKLAMSS